MHEKVLAVADADDGSVRGEVIDMNGGEEVIEDRAGFKPTPSLWVRSCLFWLRDLRRGFWIPASAGMTGVGGCGVGAYTGSPLLGGGVPGDGHWWRVIHKVAGYWVW